MYWINFDGVFEMKAATIDEIKEWMRTNETPAAFSWSRLESDGETSSVCGRWYITEDDPENLRDLDHITRFKWLFNDLAMIEDEKAN